MSPPAIRVLLVDDDREDYILTRDLLQGIQDPRLEIEWTDNFDGALQPLVRNEFDVCLLDYRLGSRNGLELLREAIAGGSKTPVILLTGQGDHEIDVAAMGAGAADYLVKGNITTALLERCIRYTIARSRAMQEREQLITQLQKALADVKTLSGLLPICSGCKKIRDDSGYWTQIEMYLYEHIGADFSHGVCPECAHKLYPEYFQKELTA